MMSLRGYSSRSRAGSIRAPTHWYVELSRSFSRSMHSFCDVCRRAGRAEIPWIDVDWPGRDEQTVKEKQTRNRYSERARGERVTETPRESNLHSV